MVTKRKDRAHEDLARFRDSNVKALNIRPPAEEELLRRGLSRMGLEGMLKYPWSLCMSTLVRERLEQNRYRIPLTAEVIAETYNISATGATTYLKNSSKYLDCFREEDYISGTGFDIAKCFNADLVPVFFYLCAILFAQNPGRASKRCASTIFSSWEGSHKVNWAAILYQMISGHEARLDPSQPTVISVFIGHVYHNSGKLTAVEKELYGKQMDLWSIRESGNAEVLKSEPPANSDPEEVTPARLTPSSPTSETARRRVRIRSGKAPMDAPQIGSPSDGRVSHPDLSSQALFQSRDSSNLPFTARLRRFASDGKQISTYAQEMDSVLLLLDSELEDVYSEIQVMQAAPFQLAEALGREAEFTAEIERLALELSSAQSQTRISRANYEGITSILQELRVFLEANPVDLAKAKLYDSLDLMSALNPSALINAGRLFGARLEGVASRMSQLSALLESQVQNLQLALKEDIILTEFTDQIFREIETVHANYPCIWQYYELQKIRLTRGSSIDCSISWSLDQIEGLWTVTRESDKDVLSVMILYGEFDIVDFSLVLMRLGNLAAYAIHFCATFLRGHFRGGGVTEELMLPKQTFLRRPESRNTEAPLPPAKVCPAAIDRSAVILSSVSPMLLPNRLPANHIVTPGGTGPGFHRKLFCRMFIEAMRINEELKSGTACLLTPTRQERCLPVGELKGRDEELVWYCLKENRLQNPPLLNVESWRLDFDLKYGQEYLSYLRTGLGSPFGDDF